MAYLTGRVAIVTGPKYGGSFPEQPVLLAGTTGEASNSTKLTPGTQARLLVGAQAIRFTLRGTLSAASQVSATHPLLAANSHHDWEVETGSEVVYVQSSDGSTAYQAWVWQAGC